MTDTIDLSRFHLTQIPGYENLYAVTREGIIYGLPKIMRGARGQPVLLKGRWLKPRHTVSLENAEGVRKYYVRSTLVWTTFNGPVPQAHILSFKDGDKTNCALDNLHLLTEREAYELALKRFEAEKNQHEKTTSAEGASHQVLLPGMRLPDSDHDAMAAHRSANLPESDLPTTRQADDRRSTFTDVTVRIPTAELPRLEAFVSRLLQR